MSLLNRNSILTGSVDSFCLVCESHLRSEDDALLHVAKPIHRKNLDAVSYLDKFKEDHVRKVKKGYYCEYCNILMTTAAKVGPHVADGDHSKNKVSKPLKREGKGVLAFNKVFITENAWHGLIDNTCTVCDAEFDNPDIHKTGNAHVLKLVLIEIEFADQNIYRKVDDSTFQCLTCNMVCAEKTMAMHFDTQEHRNLYQLCCKTDAKADAKANEPEDTSKIVKDEKQNKEHEISKKDDFQKTLEKEKPQKPEVNKPKEELGTVMKLGKIDQAFFKALGAKDFVVRDITGDHWCILCDFMMDDAGFLAHMKSRHHLTLLRMHQKRMEEKQIESDKEREENNSEPESKIKILGAVKEFTKNNVLLNIAEGLAYCRVCSKNIDFEFEFIKNHIDEHKKKPAKAAKVEKLKPFALGSNKSSQSTTHLSIAAPMNDSESKKEKDSSACPKDDSESKKEKDSSAGPKNISECKKEKDSSAGPKNDSKGNKKEKDSSADPKTDSESNNEKDSSVGPENGSETKKEKESSAGPKNDSKCNKKEKDSSAGHANDSDTKKEKVSSADPKTNSESNKEKDSSAGPKNGSESKKGKDSSAGPGHDSEIKKERNSSAGPKNDSESIKKKDSCAGPKNDSESIKVKDSSAGPKNDSESKKKDKNSTVRPTKDSESKKEDSTANPKNDPEFKKAKDSTADPKNDSESKKAKDSSADPKNDSESKKKEDSSAGTASKKREKDSSVRPKKESESTQQKDFEQEISSPPPKKPKNGKEKASAASAREGDSELEIFSKLNDMNYNSNNKTAFCRVCVSKVPPTLKSMKEHVNGSSHKNKLAKVVVPCEATVRKKPFCEFVRTFSTVETTLVKDVIINEKYCLNLKSFYLLTRYGSRLRCQACQVNMTKSMVEVHKRTPCHERAMNHSSVVMSEGTEFIREIRPNMFHCGFCNLLESTWRNMESHLKSTTHRECKVAAYWRAQEYAPLLMQHTGRMRMEYVMFSRMLTDQMNSN